MTRYLLICALALAFDAGAAGAQTTASASICFYVVPGDDNYLQPTVRADADRLHLEARYNYEGRHTMSLWGGYTFRHEKAVALSFTPMVGLIAGDVSGVAPGGEVWLGWRLIELYSEGEYVVDLDHQADSFFYSWSELALSLPLQCRVGGALQRTQTHATPREFQGGVLVGATVGRLELTVHVFDLDLDDRTWILAAAMSF